MISMLYVMMCPSPNLVIKNATFYDIFFYITIKPVDIIGEY
jgi:hypothetical protein